MGISIAEFRVAMESYGAKRLPDQEGSRYAIIVPCFVVKDVKFLHSGSYYIVQRGNKVPDEIMDKAMAEFGEKDPGGDNYWWGETHTVKGILTLAAMLDGKYNKELIDELTNITYKKLLNNTLIRMDIQSPYTKLIRSPKMKELCEKLVQYDSIVNPFASSDHLKDPIEYFDSLMLSVALGEKTPYARLTLESKSAQARYENDSNGWSFNSIVQTHENKKSICINMGHYYTNGHDSRPYDEVVFLNKSINRNSYDRNPEDIDLRISLRTGLAWQTYDEENAIPATEEQIALMILYLSKSIKQIRRSIIKHIA